MRNNDTSTTGNARAGASSTTSTDTGTSSTAPAKPYGHGSRESDVAHVTGAYVGEEKARRDRDAAGVKTIRSTIDGEPPTIRGETVDQMRERVARERDEAPATAFQKSLTGRRPADMGAGAEGTTVGGASIAPAAGAAGATSTGGATGGATGGTSGTAR